MERRVYKRTKSVFSVTANYEKLGYKTFIHGETANISLGGACLVLDKSLPADSKIGLQFNIPSDFYFATPENTRTLQTDARIMWVDQPRESHVYRCGVQFENIKDPIVSAINAILKKEEDNLPKRNWEVSHPKISLPTVPTTHGLLNGLCPTSLSVDVTNICNLRCKHCFWDSYDSYLSTDTNDNIIDKTKQVLDKFPSITNITWYGGEPLINRKTLALLEQGIKLRKNNLIITNGTIPIPAWRENVHFAVSIDGTKEIHDTIRGKGIYEKTKHNILVAMEHNIPIAFLYCINAVNIDCIPSFLAEWAHTKHIGIVFTMYVPLKGKADELTINDTQREKAVSILMEMKSKYGGAICNTEFMIELIKSKYNRKLAENCPMNVFNSRGRIHCLHLCNDGTIRVPCAIGAGADHLQCRSVTKVALYAGTVAKDRKSFLSLLRMYLSKPHDKSKPHTVKLENTP